MELPNDAVPIKGAIDHWVDPRGEVYCIDKRNGKHNQLIKKAQHKCWGYKYTTVTYAEKGKVSKRVHRLVAEAFLPKPEGCDIVMHINNKKDDNRVENLKWGTLSENTQQAVDDGLFVNDKGWDDSQSIAVDMYDTLTNQFLKSFGSMKEASRETGILSATIASCVRGAYANKDSFLKKKTYFVKHGESPIPHKIVGCFDFDTDKEIGRYVNCAQASKATGVSDSAVASQTHTNKKPKIKHSGMYFKYIIV